MTPRIRLPRPGRTRVRSLRAQLTVANVVLLALGIVAATAVSVLGMRYYLLDQIDTELLRTRDSLGGSELTLRQIDSLSALSFFRDRVDPEWNRDDDDPDSVFAAVDRAGEPVPVFGFAPSRVQRDLADAVGDPEPLIRAPEPRDVSVRGNTYRVTATRLADGTGVLVAGSTQPLHDSIVKAVKFDLAIGTLLLLVLACLTMMGVRRRMRPLEDMVETSSAIAEGDLTRRVPSSYDTSLEVEQLRLALNSMLQQVESAYRTRERSAAQLRRFVADASHELRTPLAAIRGYLQLYERGMLRDPTERKRAWDRMTAESDRMGRLVDELLVLARLDQRPELRKRNVDVCLSWSGTRRRTSGCSSRTARYGWTRTAPSWSTPTRRACVRCWATWSATYARTPRRTCRCASRSPVRTARCGCGSRTRARAWRRRTRPGSSTASSAQAAARAAAWAWP